MTPENQVRTAPYVAFKSFCSAVQGLRVHGLPSTLNRTAWESRSGAEQSQILGTLTFLGLINDKGETQPSQAVVRYYRKLRRRTEFLRFVTAVSIRQRFQAGSPE